MARRAAQERDGRRRPARAVARRQPCAVRRRASCRRCAVRRRAARRRRAVRRRAVRRRPPCWTPPGERREQRDGESRREEEEEDWIWSFEAPQNPTPSTPPSVSPLQRAKMGKGMMRRRTSLSGLPGAPPSSSLAQCSVLGSPLESDAIDAAICVAAANHPDALLSPPLPPLSPPTPPHAAPSSPAGGHEGGGWRTARRAAQERDDRRRPTRLARRRPPPPAVLYTTQQEEGAERWGELERGGRRGLDLVI